MFLLVNDQQHVIIGPRPDWNYRLIQSAVDDELGEEGAVMVPRSAPEAGTRFGPFKVYHVTDTGYDGNLNPKTQFLDGPLFNYLPTGVAESSWIIVDKPIDLVKSDLKAVVVNNRWKAEISGIKLTIQDKEYTLDTNRGSRDIFAQALLLGSDGSAWKFPEGWVNLSNAELRLVVDTIIGHVQRCFNWENVKVEEILSKTTLDDLDKVDLEYGV